MLSAEKIRAYYNIIQINQHRTGKLTTVFQDSDAF